MQTATHVDLNKTPDAAPIKHAFFFCPTCNGVADTVKKSCENKSCEFESVVLQMSCDKCKLIAGWTHWEVH
jgi:hypothetical protein